MMSESETENTPIANATAALSNVQRKYQQILDRWTPFVFHRWIATGGLLTLFGLRIVLAQGVSFIVFFCLEPY